MHWLNRALNRTATVYLASVASFVIAALFIFVWAPHPWGWEGIDHYHDLGLLLARGEPFPTTDVPWGYGYFLAAFFRMFGDRPWIPLLAQASLNALVPILTFRLIALELDRRTAIAAAVLTGVASFNTIYASTLSSDAVCTVLFMAGLLAFAAGRRSGSLAAFAGAGLFFGLAPQFRPNLLLLPAVLAALYLLSRPRNLRKAWQMAVCLAITALMLVPWTVRNYRLLGLVLPTSSHGGVQLWYGSLQTGPYLTSRAYNPRSAFESSAFDYSSAAGRPILVAAELAPCPGPPPASTVLVYWTDRHREPVRLAPSQLENGLLQWQVPGQALPTVIYYFLEARWPPRGDEAELVERLPEGGITQPAVYFVSDAHVTDPDIHGDLLDVFDIIRMVGTLAWHDPPADALPHGDRLDFDADGRVTEADLTAALDILVRLQPGDVAPGATLSALTSDSSRARLAFADGSTLSIPRAFTGRVTDVTPSGEYAFRVIHAAVPFSTIAAERERHRIDRRACRPWQNLAVNKGFASAEPDSMRRYTALAWDNIRRDPGAYLLSCAYRAWRLFVVSGTDDHWTAQQFSGSRLVYGVATAASGAYLCLLLAGIALAVRQRRALLVLLTPILYVPATIVWVLTNMRYTVTVQPLVFAFIALVGVAVLDRARNRTAPRP
jgi:4-amino-4-deoxy-L-arabinose transferase-like glycosyltransferase